MPGKCVRHSTINSDATYLHIKEELLGNNEGPKAAKLAWQLPLPGWHKQPEERTLMMNTLGLLFVLAPSFHLKCNKNLVVLNC
jgi:hypothetical protein